MPERLPILATLVKTLGSPKPIALYTVLNPYRRKRQANTKTWPHWLLNKTYQPAS